MKMNRTMKRMKMMTLYDKEKQLFRIKEVAKILYGKDFTEGDVNRLYKAGKRGDLEIVKFGGTVHVRRQQIEELLAND